MFIILGCLAGLAAGKVVTFTSDFIYEMTKGKKNDRKWTEFMILYNRLKAEHIAIINKEK